MAEQRYELSTRLYYRVMKQLLDMVGGYFYSLVCKEWLIVKHWYYHLFYRCQKSVIKFPGFNFVLSLAAIAVCKGKTVRCEKYEKIAIKKIFTQGYSSKVYHPGGDGILKKF